MVKEKQKLFTLESRAEHYLRPNDKGVPRGIDELRDEYDPILKEFADIKFDQKNFSSEAEVSISPKAELRSVDQIRYGRGTIIKAGAILNGRSNSYQFGIDVGDDFYVKEHTYIDAYGGKISIGRGAAIAQFCAIHGNGGVKIGDYLMMGHGALILAGNHNYDATSRLPFLFQGSTTKGITIGSNVWLGASVIVLDGASIGDNVVISAGTTVRGKVPSNSLVVVEQPTKIIPLV